jgi:hypothetical protein
MKGACEYKSFNFQTVSSWCQEHQMSFSMVVETQNHVSYNWIPYSSNLGDYWITNWNEKKKSLVRTFTILTRYHLQLDNLNNLIFVRKKWPNYLKVGCKSPFRFLKLIDVELEV